MKMDVTAKSLREDFVTEDEIAASLTEKNQINDNDSVSLSGSCVSAGTLSNLSACSAFSLNALKQRKNQLIESIRSQLSSSCANESTMTPNTSLLTDGELFTSTPYKENVPPAAKLLKDWHCFSNIEEIAEKDDSSEDAVGYKEAFKSLQTILGESEDMLGTYESALEKYKKDEDEKFKEMTSFFVEPNETYSISLAPLTVIDLITKSDIENVSDTNDNTIIAIDSTIEQETILKKDQLEINEEPEKVSTELDLKDPENVIIAGEEDVSADITLVDEEKLLASDNEEDIVPSSAPPVPVKKETGGWTEFISNDPDENRDNNDPMWEHLRNLEVDQRYRAVRERWRNIEIPNPRKDLTCRSRPYTQHFANTVKMRNNEKFFKTGSTVVSESQSRKRPHSPTNDFSEERPKKEACTILFDRGIKKALADLEYNKKTLDQEQKKALNHLADKQRLDQIEAHYRHINDEEKAVMKSQHFKETVELMRNFQIRRDNLMATSKIKLDALKQAATEVHEFYEFYPVGNDPELKKDKNSIVLLSDIEVDEILEVESMFIQFEQFYSGSKN